MSDWLMVPGMAYALTFVLLLGLLLLVWQLPNPRRADPKPEGPAGLRDLRLWASLLIAVQASIYLMFWLLF